MHSPESISSPPEEQIVLVDRQDTPLGFMGKTEVHKKGLLHRAISVFVFNARGEFMLQRRADHKYHSGGLWTNTCCSHPRPGEPSQVAAHRRLREEMGFDTELSHAFSFVYRAEFDNGLIEHELDHVYVGFSEEIPEPEPAEVGAWRWLDRATLQRELEASPERFTAWFRIVLPRLEAWLDRTETLKQAI